MRYLFYYLILINAVGFVIMLADKIKAKRGAWRIPEARLMSIALSGGCFGIYAGMILFRHKTKHPKFTVTVPLLLILHVVALLRLYKTL